MSMKSRQKQREKAMPTGQRKGFIWGSLIAISALGICVVFYSIGSTPKPLTYEKLLTLSPGQLAKVDVAEMNLLCATNLPGSEHLDIPACLSTLDAWAAYAKQEIERNLHQYYDNPNKFHNMEGYYRMAMLITILKLDYGCHYDERRDNDEPAETFFASSDDLFIHGLITGRRAGTCASIPVLVVSVAQRLGYPVKLVSARSHLFVRWEDGKDRFNIEASNNGGMVSHSDDDYRSWPKPITDDMIASEGYLVSMPPTQELADFLFTRSICLEVNGNIKEAGKAIGVSVRLQPQSKIYPSRLAYLTKAEAGQSGTTK